MLTSQYPGATSDPNPNPKPMVGSLTELSLLFSCSFSSTSSNRLLRAPVRDARGGSGTATAFAANKAVEEGAELAVWASAA